MKWTIALLLAAGSFGCTGSGGPGGDLSQEKPYVVLERGDIRAVIANNEAVDDEVLARHRGGYSGLASLSCSRGGENVFVPFYSGLNFEHIHDGTTQEEDVLFEPRRAGMAIRQIDDYTVEMYQPPTPHWKLESRLEYELLEEGVIELRFECVPHERTFANGYIGLFFASYIERPESRDIHFLGCPAECAECEPQWVTGATPAHGKFSTHPGLTDNRDFQHDAEFPLTLVFNFSKYRFAEPWYYGVSNGMAMVFMFREGDQVRFSQSPSGGGRGNPAWDFQWFVEEYEIGKPYTFVMRLMYVPFESREQVAEVVRPHLAELNGH